jgi:hypothetical protein
MPAPAHRRDNGSPANAIMFTRKMPRSNSHLSQLARYHSTYEFVIAVKINVPISKRSAFVSLNRK